VSLVTVYIRGGSRGSKTMLYAIEQSSGCLLDHKQGSGHMIQDITEGGGKKPYTNRRCFAWGRAYAYFFSTFAHFPLDITRVLWYNVSSVLARRVHVQRSVLAEHATRRASCMFCVGKESLSVS
jgi:hypothetical protein